MEFTNVKIRTTVPPEYADEVRQALGATGAGEIGHYSFCSFSVVGEGRFRPDENADPYVGEPGQLAVVEEILVEVFCGRAVAKAVVTALRQAHPYEKPVIDIIPLLDEDAL